MITKHDFPFHDGMPEASSSTSSSRCVKPIPQSGGQQGKFYWNEKGKLASIFEHRKE